MQPGQTAFDIKELLGTKIGPETSFCHYIIGQTKRGLRGDDRIASMRDIGERAAMDEHRIVFERLYEIWQDRILHDHGHRAFDPQIAHIDRFAIIRIRNKHLRKPLFEIHQVFGKAEGRHDLAGHSNIETIFPLHAVDLGSQSDVDTAQFPVIHIEAAFEGNVVRIDIQGISLINMVVDDSGDEVVARCDRVHIAREVKVDILHRNDLGISASGSSSF